MKITFDPPVPIEVLPGAIARQVELSVVQQAIELNPRLVEILVARHLGYDTLADSLREEL